MRRGVDLWRRTCFEAFVRIEGRPEYHELNFAPSGEWAAYAFRSYRDGAPVVDDGLAPRVAVRVGPERIELDADVELGRLSPSYAGARLRLALAAVVEAADGRISYWAIVHPPGRPDFHHADSFAIVLEAAPGEW
jgi:hypothetical protein